MRNLIITACASALLAGCATGSTGYEAGTSYSTANDGVFMDAYEAAKREDYVTAERELVEMLERDSDDPYANLAMGYVLQQTGRADQSRPYYELALAKGEDVYPDRHYVLSDEEYSTRPVEEDSIAELAARNIKTLESN